MILLALRDFLFFSCEACDKLLFIKEKSLVFLLN